MLTQHSSLLSPAIMEAANKSEAERCLEIARKAKEDGNFQKARRFADKSLNLCFTQRAEDFLNELENCGNGEDSDRETREDGEGEGVRRRRRERSGEREEEYSQEQKEAVDRVLKCRDYYEILGLSRDATEADLKRQYRKLALLLHPDKNRAPMADDAFKTVSNAYGILNDAEKRNRYDRFGEQGVGGSTAGRHAFTDAEELFRSFFGSNFTFDSFDDVFTRQYSSGHLFTTTRRPRYHSTRREPVSGWVQLFQMMPILVILSVSLFSTFIYPFINSPPYLLYRTSSHPIERQTKVHEISYFVTESFNKDYPTAEAIRRLERDVLAVRKYELREECYEARRRQGLHYGRRQGTEDPAPCQELQRLVRG